MQHETSYSLGLVIHAANANYSKQNLDLYQLWYTILSITHETTSLGILPDTFSKLIKKYATLLSTL